MSPRQPGADGRAPFLAPVTTRGARVRPGAVTLSRAQRADVLVSVIGMPGGRLRLIRRVRARPREWGGQLPAVLTLVDPAELGLATVLLAGRSPHDAA